MEPPSPSLCNPQKPLKGMNLCRTTKICFLATFSLAYVRKQLLTSLREEGGKSLNPQFNLWGASTWRAPSTTLGFLLFLSTDSLYRWRSWGSGRRGDLPWSHGPFCLLVLLLINFPGCKDLPEAFFHPHWAISGFPLLSGHLVKNIQPSWLPGIHKHLSSGEIGWAAFRN